MAESDSFHTIFPSNPSQWPYGTGQKGLTAQIRKNRTALDNALFFDLLLVDVGQINDGAKLYPPKSREDLRRLHDKIQESETDSLKKTCLYYYLLKDFKVDNKFAAEAAIPEQFCQLISGFYALDHLHFEDAVQAFSYPQVYPGYTDKILSTLLKHSDDPRAAQLAVLYVDATGPVLDSTDKMTMYMEALIRTDVASAFRYQRTAPESIRRDLFISLIDSTLQDPPPRSRLQRLLSLPLSALETDIFVDHLKATGGDGELSKDILLLWNIQTARFSEARNMISGESHADEKQRVIRDGLEKVKLSI